MKRFLVYAIGSGLGCGYAPLAPGTVGSLLALALFLIWPEASLFWLALALFFLILGIPISTSIENDLGQDPSLVVIDEVVGQWLALLFLPFFNWQIALGAFALFRLFDIWKPFPIDRSQNLKGGWGIMLDDVLAGIYANLVLQIILRSGLV